MFTAACAWTVLGATSSHTPYGSWGRHAIGPLVDERACQDRFSPGQARDLWRLPACRYTVRAVEDVVKTACDGREVVTQRRQGGSRWKAQGREAMARPCCLCGERSSGMA